jgi:hypothetical protein
MTGSDLLNRGTDTVVSQLSEEEQGIMCVKEDIGKYDMWYGVVCKSDVLHIVRLLPDRMSRHGVIPRHNDNFSKKLSLL